MKVKNTTKKAELSEQAHYKDSFLGRFRGLMLTKKSDAVLAAEKEGVLETTIHMMNMRYPIDVVWVGEDMKVKDVAKNVRPFNILKPSTWRTYKPKAPAKYVVELGRNTAQDTEVGDTIEFLTP